MNKVTIIIVLIIISGLSVLFLSSNQNRQQTVAPSPTVPFIQTETIKVDIRDFAFEPKVVTIKVGTTITWTNKDDVAHDVTSDIQDEVLHSELLEKGESYSFKFNQAGIYNYHCHPHPNMQARVVVTE